MMRVWDLVDDEGVIGCGIWWKMRVWIGCGIWWKMRVWLFFFC